MSNGMDVHDDDLVAASLSHPLDIKEIENAIAQSRKDNDVQTVFYLNSISALEVNPDALQITTYDWATRIEVEVQNVFGGGNQKDRHSIKASWERASYRAGLVDSLAKRTPWLESDSGANEVAHKLMNDSSGLLSSTNKKAASDTKNSPKIITMTS